VVSALFATLGAKIIDTDILSRELVAAGTPGLQAVVARFGPNVLLADGNLDRAHLRQLVFGDAQARADLEAILHPRIREAVAERSRRLGGPYQIIVVPLLAETQTQDQYDRCLVVDCDPALQRSRLLMRDGVTPALATQMLRAQSSREARLAIADDVLVNEGELAQLTPKIAALHQAYLALGTQAQ
jgi:dephospho-CoA kinase